MLMLWISVSHTLKKWCFFWRSVFYDKFWFLLAHFQNLISIHTFIFWQKRRMERSQKSKKVGQHFYAKANVKNRNRPKQDRWGQWSPKTTCCYLMCIGKGYIFIFISYIHTLVVNSMSSFGMFSLDSETTKWWLCRAHHFCVQTPNMYPFLKTKMLLKFDVKDIAHNPMVFTIF